MSYLNSDQLEYIDQLSKIPLAAKCWCGWYKLGECVACNENHPGKTRADHMADHLIEPPCPSENTK